MAVAAAAALAACGAPPPPEPDTTVSLTVIAGADVNPDADRRPSPVVLRIYELASDDMFRSAPYFDLRDAPDAALGDTLLGQQEVILNPGSSQQRNFGVSNEARAIGVVADFQDIENAVWRGHISIRTGEDNQLSARLSAGEVVLTLFRP